MKGSFLPQVKCYSYIIIIFKQSYINIVFIFRRTWKKKKDYKAIFITFPRSKRVKKCLSLICLYKQRVNYSKEFVFRLSSMKNIKKQVI